MRLGITEPQPFWRRLTWFVGIWAASVSVLCVVAWLLRAAIG